jgi:hypothetical protein
MSALKDIRDLLSHDGFIVCNKNLLWSIGQRSTIVYYELLSRYIYFKDRGQLTKDGYFFNTVNDLWRATALREKQQRTEIKKLIKLGLVTQDNRGTPTTRHFKISKNITIIKGLIKEGVRKAEKAAPGGYKNDYSGLPKWLTNKNKLIRIIKKKNLDRTNSVDVDFYTSVFEYYVRCYEENHGVEHPILKDEHWVRVIDTIDLFLSYNVNVEDENIYKMIDAHFRFDTQTNGNIIAFATEDALKTKFYQAGFVGFIV